MVRSFFGVFVLLEGSGKRETSGDLCTWCRGEEWLVARLFMQPARDALEDNDEVKKRDFSSGGDINDGGLRGKTDACMSGAEDRLEGPLVDGLLHGVRERRR